MVHWFQTLDASLFHWINPTLSNPVLDVLMTFASGNQFFAPVLLVASILLIWRGGARGRICVLMLLLSLIIGDTVICNTLKQLIHRPRPFLTLQDVHIPSGIGMTDSGSMPSSHAANWFAGAMVLLIYYRRSVWFMLPLTLIVGFSRIYNGVHYPSDVLAGAVLGAGYAAGIVLGVDWIWQWAGHRWFPLWWQRLPSLMNPKVLPVQQESVSRDPQLADRQWMRLGYLLIFVELIANLAYIASGKIGLQEDEAYNWVWSKHLALSYISKPLMIALTQFAGTHLWGDTTFGVRFFSPIIGAIISVVLLRFMARVVNTRAAFWLSVVVPTTPLLGVGSILMTVDPLSVLFWTLAMTAGWRAVQDDAKTGDWLWVGLWMGLGFLSKYTAPFLLLCWAVFFVLWPPARRQMRRPGPYLALLITLTCAAPVVIWNAQHGWITVFNVARTGNLDKSRSQLLETFTPSHVWMAFHKYTLEFLGAEAGLQNPFYFLPVIWAAIVFWKRRRDNPLPVYFFSMGAPVFLFYLLLTFHTRDYPNWIVPSILPLFCLATVYWDGQWRAGFRAIQYWLYSGLILGGLAVVLLRDGDLITRLTGCHLPPRLNVWTRLEGWPETAQAVEAAREKLLAEGKPVFIIGEHYSITSEVSFYLPEAKAGVPDHPLAYYLSSDFPKNQYYFWPGYKDRKGQNAIFVQDLGLKGDKPPPPIDDLQKEFKSVQDIGTVTVMHDGQPMRILQLIECRGLR